MLKFSVSLFGQTTGFISWVESQSDYQKLNIRCLVFNNKEYYMGPLRYVLYFRMVKTTFCQQWQRICKIVLNPRYQCYKLDWKRSLTVDNSTCSSSLQREYFALCRVKLLWIANPQLWTDLPSLPVGWVHIERVDLPVPEHAQRPENK